MNESPTGLVIPFPLLETKIGAFRQQAIQPTTFNLMAHLTIIFPFMPLNQLTSAASSKLEMLFKETDPISYTIDGLGRFPEVLYLKVADERPFIHLIRSIETAFPDYPSFGGQFQDIVPHITIAKNENIDQSEAEFRSKFPNLLPLSGICREVWLINNIESSYQMHTTYQLGSGETHDN